MLTTNELGDISHRARTVEGIHGDEVLEDGGLQLTQVFLHACRLKLERTNGAAFLIELERHWVVDGDMVEIDINATRLLDNGTGFLHLRQRLQTQKVHLDEARRLDDVTIVLGTIGLRVLEVGVVSSADRHPVTNRVATDDEATGMDTRTSHRAFEHLGILDGVGESNVVGSLSLTQLGNSFDGIDQIHLRRLAVHVGQTVGYGLAQRIGNGQGHLLYTRHILDGILRSHRSVGDDMGTVLVTILVLYPLQHLTTAIVVEVGIDIGQRDTVGVQETLKQQVVL